jgi:hypothetical protein
VHSGSFSSSGRPISKKLKIGDSECDSSESKDYRSISPPSLISEGLTDSSSSDIESVLQVKITLKNITPKVWRRLLVNSNFTFEDLNFMDGVVQLALLEFFFRVSKHCGVMLEGQNLAWRACISCLDPEEY